MPEGKITFESAIYDADELVTLDIPPKKKFLGSWLTEKSISIIGAPRGVGKTFLAMSIAECITRGIDFGPWKCHESVSCLYVDGELPSEDLKERRIGFDKMFQVPRQSKYGIYSRDKAHELAMMVPDLKDSEWTDIMMNTILKFGAKVVIFDNVSCLAKRFNDRDPDNWEPIDRFLLDLRFERVSSIIVHHAGKDPTKGLRGATNPEDQADNVLMLIQPAHHVPSMGANFYTHFTKNRVCGDRTDINDMEFRLDEVENKWEISSVKKNLDEAIISLAKIGMPVLKIAESVKCRKSKVYKVIKENKAEIERDDEDDKITPL